MTSAQLRPFDRFCEERASLRFLTYTSFCRWVTEILVAGKLPTSVRTPALLQPRMRLQLMSFAHPVLRVLGTVPQSPQTGAPLVESNLVCHIHPDAVSSTVLGGTMASRPVRSVSALPGMASAASQLLRFYLRATRISSSPGSSSRLRDDVSSENAPNCAFGSWLCNPILCRWRICHLVQQRRVELAPKAALVDLSSVHRWSLPGSSQSTSSPP